MFRTNGRDSSRFMMGWWHLSVCSHDVHNFVSYRMFSMLEAVDCIGPVRRGRWQLFPDAMVVCVVVADTSGVHGTATL